MNEYEYRNVYDRDKIDQAETFLSSLSPESARVAHTVAQMSAELREAIKAAYDVRKPNNQITQEDGCQN